MRDKTLAPTRRALLRTAGLGLGVAALNLKAADTFVLPNLPYAHDALEPHIDAQTMEIHHGKHHAGYVRGLNSALENHPDLRERSIEDLLRTLNALPASVQTAVRNSGGGHANHTLFWEIMAPGGGGRPKGDLATAIDRKFGSFADFRKEIAQAATGRFGSGWAWLTVDRDRRLSVESTANQDSPLSSGRTPILGIDVWEHAYYLKYQNRRADYVEAWFNVVNWDRVSEFYAKTV